MTQRTQLNPHIRDTNSPLDAMVMRVLRRFGESSPDNIDDDAMLMFMDFANEVIDIMRAHPYVDESKIPGGELKYYVHPSDARPVCDTTMTAGLLYLYAEQQASSKAPVYRQKFFNALNTQTWMRMHDCTGSQKIQMRPVDGGTKRELAPPTSTSTGMPITDN